MSTPPTHTRNESPSCPFGAYLNFFVMTFVTLSPCPPVLAVFVLALYRSLSWREDLGLCMFTPAVQSTAPGRLTVALLAESILNLA